MKILIAMMALAAYANELVVLEEKVHTVCSFPQVDYFSTFSSQGEFLWEVPFSAQIVSWKKEGNQVFVLSKARNESAYFLSSIDSSIGKITWEKGIFAPMSNIDTEK